MYAQAFLKLQRRPRALCVPVEAVSQGKQPSVYVVNPAREIEERPVTLGLETPNKYEVVAGLKEGDLVMIGARSSVKPGQKVDPKLIGSLAQQ
jgi:multidrug efflux pump subunit AcrA (membrane-fusion protein)